MKKKNIFKEKEKPHYKKVDAEERKFLDYKSACDLLSVGRNSLDRIAEDAHAIVRFGRMKRYDKDRLIDYFREHITE